MQSAIWKVPFSNLNLLYLISSCCKSLLHLLGSGKGSLFSFYLQQVGSVPRNPAQGKQFLFIRVEDLILTIWAHCHHQRLEHAIQKLNLLMKDTKPPPIYSSISVTIQHNYQGKL